LNWKFSLVVIVILSFLTGCRSDISAQNSRTIRFMAGYKPQANLPFVGVYVAKEKGFYADAGLDVEITHSSGKGEHIQYLAAGQIDVTTADAANVLQRRSEAGVPLVSIATIGQRGQQAFAALRGSNINSISDWRGRTIGFKGTPTFDLLALIRANGLQESDVDLVNVGFDPRVLTEGLVDVYPVYKSNEPYLLEKMGFALDLWDPADAGIRTLGLTYVTTDQLIQDKPEELTIFLRETLRGIEYAADHPEEAIQITLGYCDPETDPAHMANMLAVELKDATSPNGFGYQDPARWEELKNELHNFGVVTTRQNISDVINTELWEQAVR